MSGVADSFTRTSGAARVTARGNVTLISGQAKTTAVGAGGASVAITNVSGTVPVSVAGVKVSANKLEVNIAGVNTSGGKVLTTAAGGGTNVAITNVSGQVPVTAGGAPLPVTVASQPIAVSAAAGVGGLVTAQMHAVVDDATPAEVNEGVCGAVRMTSARAMHVGIMTNPAGATVVSGAIRTTAVGAGGAAVAITNVSGDIRVTAGGLPIPVTIAAQPIAVSIAAKAAIDVSAQGGVIAVSVQNEPLVDVCGVNRTGSALNTFIAGVSGDVRVTVANAALNVNVVNVSGQVAVTAGALPIPVTIAAQPIAVSQAAPLAWEIAQRGDAVFNALVSNPVKFGKLAQVAGAVCADIVAGVAARKIRVLGGYFNSTGTATAIFMTTGASAALTPKIVMYGGFVLPITPYGYFETAVGSALSLQIEGGSIGGIITYAEVF